MAWRAPPLTQRPSYAANASAWDREDPLTGLRLHLAVDACHSSVEGLRASKHGV